MSLQKTRNNLMHGEQQNKLTRCIFYRPVRNLTGLMKKGE